MSKTEYGVWITDDAGNRTLWNKDAVADGKGTHLGTIDGVRCYTLPAVCGFFLSVPLVPRRRAQKCSNASDKPIPLLAY